MAREVVLKQGRFTAGLEDGALVVEGPGIGGELTRARLPADLDWLWQWLEFVQDAGEALSLHYAAAAQAKAGKRGRQHG